ncbi:hypothetical protein K437DRAFT_246103 [Tilletiaria anomala UBC 951]|uniref:Type 1 phosphatases regulator n=1 Tax=Tilletiaria anomala (strain ATCC 24038 / CBS 436.72 / UBC 951) TaxID=1037660 RepID=A0A066W9E3_TILAU|nr:uncharacterized protein K437DRAFT_246103 [Tilletiaria anomala UBC 951]KDN47365.1 hypothetical protein K437DRAFT_246103 [Tilletiaria anomala UBC 951]
MTTRMRGGGPSSRLDSHGSRTMTINETPTSEQENDNGEGSSQGPTVGRLILRGAGGEAGRIRPRSGRRVVWTEGTIDNEGMGKKKSKLCCIYHKPRAFDESSSSDSSSGSDHSSSDDDTDSASETSSTSSGYSGVHLSAKSKAKRAISHSEAQKTRSEEGHTQDECGHNHHPQRHRHGRDKVKYKGEKAKSGRSRRSRAVTVTEEAQEEKSEGTIDQFKRNKYERGVA